MRASTADDGDAPDADDADAPDADDGDAPDAPDADAPDADDGDAPDADDDGANQDDPLALAALSEGAAAPFALAAARQAQAQPLRPGTLYLVATPVGNLADLSLRALAVLQGASAILCEDTRRTRRLLARYGVGAPPGRLLSYHAHNERAREGQVLGRLRAGESLALVSDAGTPGISDPGSALVRRLVGGGGGGEGGADGEGGDDGGGGSGVGPDGAVSVSVSVAPVPGVSVVPVPGACAAIAALTVSGLPTDRFTFFGFLPAKPAARRAELRDIAAGGGGGGGTGGGPGPTLVFYVSPHAAPATLADCAAELGAARRCALARELTKAHEEVLRGTLAQVRDEVARRKSAGEPGARGEMVLVVEGAPGRRAAAREALARALAGGAEGEGEGGGGGGGGERGGGGEDGGGEGEGDDAASAAGAADGRPGGGAGVDVRARLLRLLREGEGAARASKRLAAELGLGRRSLYELAERLRREDPSLRGAGRKGGGDDDADAD